MNSLTQAPQSEPDPDSIKMFVGQLPRNMDEIELKKMFEDYGPVYQLNVLRDRSTGQSKGCCFVTFYTRTAALESQNALHNIKTMPSMHHPVQMKPADSEKRNELNVEDRKLFIGMISKNLNEEEVRLMFTPFGTVEDCTVLRDANSLSRGCAFVTYTTRQCTLNAIKSLHHSQTMEGCSSPLVVKTADTQKEKEQKKMSTMPSNMWMQQFSGLGNVNSQYMALMQQAAATTNMGSSFNMGNLGRDTNTLQNLQSLAALANLANNQGSMGTLGGQNLSFNQLNSGAANNTAQPAVANATGIPNMGTNNMTPGYSNMNSMNGFMNPSAQSGMDALTQAYSGIQQYAASFPNAFNTQTQIPQVNTSTIMGKQSEGPDGANLFIYHLPQEFGDQDLMQMFMPFGNVVSSKVFIDKQTNLSKCFGFVSYDSPVCAQAAITSMNGFQIGMKRLKVQLKRPKNESKPY